MYNKEIAFLSETIQKYDEREIILCKSIKDLSFELYKLETELSLCMQQNELLSIQLDKLNDN